MAQRPPNRLIREASPYLQQHAHDPVDRHPWGEEAFARARAESRPVLLSIGYSACHCCHVMEHESFQDEAIAGLMNRHFVCVKVDREEHPELDRYYQAACQLATGRGGWPLTVWLLPDGRPFHAGTYFPPVDRHGLPGFPRVLEAVADAWLRRREEVERAADSWARATAQALAPPLPGLLPGEEGFGSAEAAALRLAEEADPVHGGLGRGPKFPRAPELELLLRTGRRRPELLEVVDRALRAMARGGLHDQLGGGFHRYTVDPGWRIPHFEKMLYDNALLAPLYLAAWQLEGEPWLLQVARRTLGWALREMRHPAGAFYTSQDADSEGEEGRYYLWTPEEVRALLGEPDAGLLCRHLGIGDAGGRVGEGSQPFLAAEAATLAAESGEDPAELEARLRRGCRRLLRARLRRPRPGRDEKVLAGWNGLMVRALALAARGLGEARYARAAERAAAFILERMTRTAAGSVEGARGDGAGAALRLLRCYREGFGADLAATLEDFAFLADGLLELYPVAFDRRWLRAAAELGRSMVERFWSPQEGFLLAEGGLPEGHGAGAPPPAPAPVAAWQDEATPSPASVAVRVLLRLAAYTGEARFRQVAEEALELYRAVMEQLPQATAGLWTARLTAEEGPLEVTLLLPGGSAAGPAAAVAGEWLRRLHRRYLPDLVLERARAEEAGVALAAGRRAADGRLTAYVCRGRSCFPPAVRWSELERRLEGPGEAARA
ncbi:MAG: thioredoxin domain-containing protein [Bacillota bacterium]|nr:thioredoxin domain-containing protein [Bacillota bacterium]